MSSFKEYVIGDLCEVRRGASPRPIHNYISASGMPWLKIADATSSNSRFITRTHEYIREEGIPMSVRVFPGDLVLSNSATPGLPKFMTIEACIHDGWLLLREFKIVIKEYLYYVLLAARERLVGQATGTIFNNLKTDTVRNLHVLIPDIQQQNKIVDLLTALDDKIELNLHMNKTLEAIALAIFKEWFVDFRFPGFDGDLVNGLPKGWSKDEFDNHITAERGLSYKGSGLAAEGKGIPMHNLNSIYEGGGYKYEGIKHYAGEYKERHTASPGDIIVANTEQGHKYLLIGYPAVVPQYYEGTSIFSHHIYRVKPKSESSLTSQFIYYLLLQPHIRDQVVGCCNGTTVNMLKIDGLQRPVFNLPTRELIKKFSEVVQGIWQKKESNYFENQTLIQVRDSLLPKLMTGKIRVN